MDRETQVFHTRTRQGGIRAGGKARIYANNLGSFFSRLDERKWLCFEKRSRASSREMSLFYIYIYIYIHSRSTKKSFEEIPILQLLIGYPCPNGRYLIETISIKLFGSVCPKIYLWKKKKTPGEQSANSVIRAYWET